MDEKQVTKLPIWEKVLLTKEEASSYSNIGLNRLQLV